MCSYRHWGRLILSLAFAFLVCLFAADTSVSVADLMFARSLRAADHLLCIVDNQAPDLGGSATVVYFM